MINQEKQNMADAISTKMRSIAEECDENLQFEYDVYKLALTALTAQPVKFPPPIEQTETLKYGLESRDGYGLYWGSLETLKECKRLLRQQGYEVEE